MLHKFITILCSNCGDRFDVPVYCGDRFCPICSVARRIRIRNRLEFLVKNVSRRTGYNFKHLTLTIKNQKNLALMTSDIVKCFRNLRKTRSWKTHVCGGAFVCEITGYSGNWHVHLHVIIQSKYYPFKEILHHWMKLSPGRGVYIQNIPKNQIVRYLTKYLTKSDVPDADHYEMNQALKGMRLFQPFGDWFSINRLYIKPAQHCRKCDKPCFCLYGETFKGEGFFIEKEVEIKPTRQLSQTSDVLELSLKNR